MEYPVVFGLLFLQILAFLIGMFLFILLTFGGLFLIGAALADRPFLGVGLGLLWLSLTVTMVIWIVPG